MMHVLVVDDDEETLEVTERALERDGHRVFAARTPSEATRLLESTAVDLIVLDVMLGDDSGLDFCSRLRQEGSEIPILFLSARGAVKARLDGFDAGGDDYLSKPFALRELVARVRALGRRGPAIRARCLEIGGLSLDFDERRATAVGTEVPVTRREWDILRTLADAKGRVVAFDVVLERVWGDVSPSTRASLEVLVSRLRKKLDAAAGRPVIRTARGLGYSLELDP
ncbi:MAG: response regulator transcription factor [Polyangiales bacterium]